MIFNMNSGGGTALNFAVKAYATEAELLAAVPKENTIGIITTAPITSWIFSTTEPEAYAEGMVWISTATKSPAEFNALKKNAIQVYPVSAKQYTNGAWVGLNAMVYQSGNWVSISGVVLYENGNEQESVTGGWKARGMKITESANAATAPTLTKNPASMSASLARSGSNGNGGVVEIVNDIDLTDYKQLVVTFAKAENVFPNLLGVIVYKRSISKTGSGYEAPWSNTKASVNVSKSFTKPAEYSVDITTVNGNACIGIALYNAAHDDTLRCEITKVELVR